MLGMFGRKDILAILLLNGFDYERSLCFTKYCLDKRRGLVTATRYFRANEEIEILREYYPIEGRKCAARFSRKRDVQSKACELGIRFIKDLWTDEEIEILREYYPKVGAVGCKKMLPNRDVSSKARELGLKVEGRKISAKAILFSEEEDEIIIKYYKNNRKMAYASLPNRSPDSIQDRAARLGIKVQYWTPEEEEILRCYYPIEGKKCAIRMAGKTEEEVRNRAKAIKIKFSNFNRKTMCKKCRPVKCIETGVIYESIAEANEKTGCCHIAEVCNGRRKMDKGYRWEYVEEEIK